MCSPSLLGQHGSCSISPLACGTFLKHSTNTVYLFFALRFEVDSPQHVLLVGGVSQRDVAELDLPRRVLQEVAASLALL